MNLNLLSPVVCISICLSLLISCSKEDKIPGCVEGNCRNGLGTLKKPDGSVYVGSFREGEKDGEGTLTLTDGVSYEGSYRNGFKDGQGTLTTSDGTVYVGSFRNDKMDGQGTLTTPDGKKYNLQYSDGKVINFIDAIAESVRNRQDK